MRRLEVGVVNHVCDVLIRALIGIRDVSWMSQVEGGIYKQVATLSCAFLETREKESPLFL